MWIKSLKIKNVRSFINTEVEFSPNLNVIVGANNSGKTTILKSLLALQGISNLNVNDTRIGANTPMVSIETAGKYEEGTSKRYENKVFDFNLVNNSCHFRNIHGNIQGATLFTNQEPNNYIYPFLSKRKVTSYQEAVNKANTNQVTGNFGNLYPKIDRVANPDFLPAYTDYLQACEDIIGFRVSAVASDGGKKGAYIIHNNDHIPIDVMGEGIVNMLALIVDLCVAENKLFLIEEPENDIHPKALKALLRLIEKKSESNQFIITSHSNIVVKFIGSCENTKVINTNMEFINKIPTSTISYANTQEQRQAVLEDLGYEMNDFNLWEFWLFLEESSAEEIIREILIPIFTPSIQSKIRTFSCSGINKVEPKFEDFNRLFVFLHMQQSYVNKAWVIADGGKNEEDIITRIRNTYKPSGWSDENFINLHEHDFEKYYPDEFSDEIDEITNIQDNNQKRNKKSDLLKKVVLWSQEDIDRAKLAFEKSASEVIEILRTIEKSIAP